MVVAIEVTKNRIDSFFKYHFQTFKSHPAVKLNQRQLEDMVSELNISPGTASDILIKHFLEKSS